MRATNHTPGPWVVSPYNNVTSRNGTIAKTEQMPGNDDSERESNANLIASAPDMFGALQAVVDYLETFACHDEQGRIALSKAQETIAKAKGEA